MSSTAPSTPGFRHTGWRKGRGGSMENVMGRIHSVESFRGTGRAGDPVRPLSAGLSHALCLCHNPDSWNAQGRGEGRVQGRGGGYPALPEFHSEGRRHPFGRGTPHAAGIRRFDFGGVPRKRPAHRHRHRGLGFPVSLPESGGSGGSFAAGYQSGQGRAVSKNHRPGMDNTLELLNHCENVRKPVWIRHVLVPGLTDGRDDLCALGVLLSRYACIERVELLPFHKMGSTNGRHWLLPIP